MYAIECSMDSNDNGMRRFTGREIFGVFITLLVGLSALFSWRMFFDVSLDPNLTNTFFSFLWFFLLGAMFLLGTVVWQKEPLQAISAFAVFLPSLFYIHTWYHTLFMFLASFLLFSSARSVQKEISDRVHFHFFRNVRAGSFTFVLGLSLVLSSAYFVSIHNKSWEELVPRFSVGEGTATAIIRVVVYLYPEWKNLADEGVTVDEFLLGLKKESPASGDGTLENMPAETGETATSPILLEYLKQNVQGDENVDKETLSRELTLRTGREQIALLVGRSVNGDEKIADVFSLAIQHKILTALSGERASRHLAPTIVPVILAVLLFFTLLPLGSVASLLWITFGFFLFRVSLFLGWVKLERVEREQEVLLP